MRPATFQNDRTGKSIRRQRGSLTFFEPSFSYNVVFIFSHFFRDWQWNFPRFRILLRPSKLFLKRELSPRRLQLQPSHAAGTLSWCFLSSCWHFFSLLFPWATANSGCIW